MHKLNCGTTPTEGLRVFTNDYIWGTILVDNSAASPICGTYCEAWHDVLIDADAPRRAGHTVMYNCDRLTTRMPR